MEPLLPCTTSFESVALHRKMSTLSPGIVRGCFKTWATFPMTPFEILRAKARLPLKEWFESGDYIGWLATPADKPETVVGAAGVQLQPILPRPLDASRIGEGRQGTIVNVFTEPQ